jgi:hypothetical protein
MTQDGREHRVVAMDDVYVACWDHAYQLRKWSIVAKFGVAGLFSNDPPDSTVSSDCENELAEAEAESQSTNKLTPISSIQRLCEFCRTMQEALALVADFDDHMLDPKGDVAFEHLRQYEHEPYRPEPLIRSLWDIARTLNDSSRDRGKPRRGFPRMPTGNLSARDAIAHLDELVAWCDNAVSTATSGAGINAPDRPSIRNSSRIAGVTS